MSTTAGAPTVKHPRDNVRDSIRELLKKVIDHLQSKIYKTKSMSPPEYIIHRTYFEQYTIQYPLLHAFYDIKQYYGPMVQIDGLETTISNANANTSNTALINHLYGTCLPKLNSPSKHLIPS